jgi:hypothetical protein
MSDNRSDEEIAAEERNRWRLLSRTTVLGFLLWLAAALSLVLFFNFGEHLAAQIGIPGLVVAWFPLVILVLTWLLFLRYRKRFSPSPNSLRPGVQRRLVDDVTRRQRHIFVGLILLALYIAGNQHNPPEDSAQGFYTGLFLAFMAIAPLCIVFGPGFLNPRFHAANSDEMSRELRRRAVAIGYLTAMAAMGVDYLLYLFAPRFVETAFPFSMAAVFVIPATYFVWADWRSEREG